MCIRDRYKDFLPKQLYIPAAQWIVTDPSLLPPAVAEKHKVFYEAFQDAGVRPDIPSELSWDDSMIIVDALRKLGPNATAQQDVYKRQELVASQAPETTQPTFPR